MLNVFYSGYALYVLLSHYVTTTFPYHYNAKCYKLKLLRIWFPYYVYYNERAWISSPLFLRIKIKRRIKGTKVSNKPLTFQHDDNYQASFSAREGRKAKECGEIHGRCFPIRLCGCGSYKTSVLLHQVCIQTVRLACLMLCSYYYNLILL